MKINEVTAGSVSGQAGVFTQALGQALAGKIVPQGGNTAAAPGSAAVAPGNRQIAGLNIALKQAPVLAQTAASAWNKDLQRLMADHEPPLLSVTGVQRAELERQAWQTVDALLSRSGYGLDQLRRGTDPEDKEAWEQLQQDHAALVAASQTGKDAAIRTAWNELARSIIVAQTVLQYSNRFGSGTGALVTPKITYNPRGQLMINGTVANPNDPQDAAIIAQLQSSMAGLGKK